MTTWQHLTPQRWAALGLCAESRAEYMAFGTPEQAYHACTRADDLIRVVFALLSRERMAAILCATIRPEIAHNASAATCLSVVERWTRGDATRDEVRAAVEAVEARAAWAAWAVARAAVEAVEAAVEAAAWAAVEARSHLRMCDHIRALLPWSEVVGLLEVQR